MSKIAILKTLPTPSDVRHHVQQLSDLMDQAMERLNLTSSQVSSLNQLPDLAAQRVTEALKALDRLDRTTEQLTSLQQLPDLMALRTTEALKSSMEPFQTMPSQVDKALAAFDQVNEAQRVTLENLAKEMSRQAALSMQSEVKQLNAVFLALTSEVLSVQTILKNMESSTRKLQALPEELTKAATDSASLLRHESKELAMAAQMARPRVRTLLMQLTVASFLGALLLGIGQKGLDRLLPPGEMQQQAAWASTVWNKATEEERRSMNLIASRRAP